MKNRRKVKRLGWMLTIFSSVMILDVLFDLGKWGLGRYTVVTPTLSITTIVVFSAILALVVELIHRRRSKEERRYEQYLHHKAKVYVKKAQKGKHWDSSLCTDCAFFLPDTSDNCLIESIIHTVNRDNNLVSVIWECPKFARRGRVGWKFKRLDLKQDFEGWASKVEQFNGARMRR